jgi:hypothetical protein
MSSSLAERFITTIMGMTPGKGLSAIGYQLSARKYPSFSGRKLIADV